MKFPLWVQYGITPGDFPALLQTSYRDELIAQFLALRELTDDGCQVWRGGTRTARGYGLFWVNGRSIYSHRFIVLVDEPIPKGICICHHCDNPPCSERSHLFLGTPGDNARDREAKGKGHQAYGEAHGKVKLTEQQVLEARHLFWQEDVTPEQLARDFGVSIRAMRSAVFGQNWKHLPLEVNADRLGRRKGGRHPNAKLTETDARRILSLREDGNLLQTIADEFGVTISAIHSITSGKSWKHLSSQRGGAAKRLRADD